MQIAEVVIVLLIFFMMIGFGALFFTSFAKESTEQELSYTEALNMAETAKIVASMPELRCSLRGDLEFVCLDMYRVEAFANQIGSDNNRRHYAEAFQGYRASLTCIYPEECHERLNGVTLFDYVPRAATDTVPFVLPIVIYDPITREYAYGELELVQAS